MRRQEEFVSWLVVHQQGLYSYIRTLVPQHADAEDVLQQVSLVLWRKFDDFESDSDFLAWACRIAHYEVLNFLKKQRKDYLTFSSEFIEQLAADWSDRRDALDDDRVALHECVEKLKSGDRRLVGLYYDGQHSAKEVGETLNRPVDSVYVSLCRIRRKLRECVDRTNRRGDSL